MPAQGTYRRKTTATPRRITPPQSHGRCPGKSRACAPILSKMHPPKLRQGAFDPQDTPCVHHVPAGEGKVLTPSTGHHADEVPGSLQPEIGPRGRSPASGSSSSSSQQHGRPKPTSYQPPPPPPEPASPTPVTFISPVGLEHPLTRTHVRLLGPCFKTGRVGHRSFARCSWYGSRLLHPSRPWLRS